VLDSKGKDGGADVVYGNPGESICMLPQWSWYSVATVRWSFSLCFLGCCWLPDVDTTTVGLLLFVCYSVWGCEKFMSVLYRCTG